MSMAEDYIRAHEAMAKIVEKSFRKMSKHCEFHREGPTHSDCCWRPNGSNGHVCAREICPVLEEE
jgi:hypothetical protein